MSADLLAEFEPWQQHLAAVEAARGQLARVEALAAVGTEEHQQLQAEHQRAVEEALAAGKRPTEPPPGPSSDLSHALQQAHREVIERKSQGSVVLAGLLPQIEAAVAQRSAERNAEARRVLDQLEELRAQQQADQLTLRRSRVAADRDRQTRPSPGDRTPVCADLSAYVSAVNLGHGVARDDPVARLRHHAPQQSAARRLGLAPVEGPRAVAGRRVRAAQAGRPASCDHAVPQSRAPAGRPPSRPAGAPQTTDPRGIHLPARGSVPPHHGG